MNVELVNPFISALKNVLETMAQTELKAGKPKKKCDSVALGDVSSIIAMEGPQFNGSLSITFEESLALEIMLKMLGEKPESVNNEVADMVGEITNMVCGAAKSELADNGFDFGMASPVMFVGKEHDLVHKAKGEHVIIPFSHQTGKAYIEFCFNK